MAENTEMTIVNEGLPEVIPNIQSLIYVIRGQQIMLDCDLAMLYQVETKNLNKAMKRNEKRFPKDFLASNTSCRKGI